MEKFEYRDYVQTTLESGDPFISDIMTGPEMEMECIASVMPVTEDDELLGLRVELMPWKSGAQNRYNESIRYHIKMSGKNNEKTLPCAKPALSTWIPPL